MSFTNETVTTEKDIQRIIKEHPDLHAAGQGGLGRVLTPEQFEAAREEMLMPDFLHQVDICRAWLRGRGKTKKPNPRAGSSYGLKHKVEADVRASIERGEVDQGVDPYIANGALVTAAILEGFEVERGAFNPFINLRVRDD